MTGAEIQLLLLIVAGFGALYVRHRYRVGKRRRLAEKKGLRYSLRGLREAPSELQQSVLFLVSDGGHERDVLTGDLLLAEEHVGFIGFDMAFQRDVRGEWAFLATDPPFRLFSPATVLLYQLPREFAHLVVKRCGRADAIGDEISELYKSFASVAREMSIIDRVIAVPPPPSIGRTPMELPALAAEYRVWGADAAEARAILTEETARYLQSLAAGGRELVIELLGSIMLVYCASEASLSEEDAESLGTFSRELCRQILENTRDLARREPEDSEDS